MRGPMTTAGPSTWTGRPAWAADGAAWTAAAAVVRCSGRAGTACAWAPARRCPACSLGAGRERLEPVAVAEVRVPAAGSPCGRQRAGGAAGADGRSPRAARDTLPRAGSRSAAGACRRGSCASWSSEAACAASVPLGADCGRPGSWMASAAAAAVAAAAAPWGAGRPGRARAAGLRKACTASSVASRAAASAGTWAACTSAVGTARFGAAAAEARLAPRPGASAGSAWEARSRCVERVARARSSPRRLRPGPSMSGVPGTRPR
mmetsp:Transcript_8141/g.22396  ORF Transcript_8141/g.22396 Transcript_8141/m.22396 type:complete len:263 (-) Transcript_8141:235-1023(-)